LIEECGKVLESLCNRRFDHVIATYRYDYKSVKHGGDIDGRELLLRADCQQLLSVTNGDGVTVSTNDYVLLPDNPITHYSSVEITNQTLLWQPGTNARRAIAIRGVWGYGGRWVNTLKTLTSAMDAVQATLSINNAVGLERGQVIRVGEEYMLIETVVTGTLTVSRAHNGSSATPHDSGTAIYLFQPDTLVQRAIKRMVRWYDKLGDNPLFGLVQMGEITVPADFTVMPKDLQAMIEQLRKSVRFMGVTP